MAKKVQVLLIDDLDGGEADETITFGVDGVDYEIDLSNENAGSLREAIDKFVASGRRIGTPRGTRGTQRASRRGRGGEGPDPKVVRQWAKENGIEVTERGRVPHAVAEQYKQAHSN